MFWVWLGVAIALLVAEVLSGTFYMLVVAFGFALGAIAGMFGLGLAPQIFVIALGIIFGLILLKYTGILRRGRKSSQIGAASFDHGQVIFVPEWTDTGSARVRYRGADWDVEISDNSPKIAGQYVVVGFNGNKLLVTAHQSDEPSHKNG